MDSSAFAGGLPGGGVFGGAASGGEALSPYDLGKWKGWGQFGGGHSRGSSAPLGPRAQAG